MTSINQLRNAIAPLHQKRAELLAAGPSSAEHGEKLDAFAHWSNETGTHRIANGVVADDIRSAFIVRPLVDGSIDLAPMLSAMFGAEAFAQMLRSHLDLVPVGLDAADRQRRVAEIDAELDSLERLEEVELVRLQAAGEPVSRRGDARPEIVLALGRVTDDSTPSPEAPREAGIRKSRPVPEAPVRREGRSAYLSQGKDE